MTRFTAGDADPAAGYSTYTMRVRNLPWLRNALFYAIEQATQAGNWDLEGTATLDDAITEASLSLFTFDLGPNEVGMIFPWYGDTRQLPDKCVLCNGQSVTSADHKDFFRVFTGFAWDDSIWDNQDRPATIPVPDLRGRSIIGVNDEADDEGFNEALDEYNWGGAYGAQQVNLSVNQMPSHTHTTQPHAHSVTGAVAALINGGLEAPASAAVPFPTSTGAATVTVNSAGGGQPVNLVHPVVALHMLIRVKP